MTIIKLSTSDGGNFEVEKKIIERSVFIRNMFEDLGNAGKEVIELPNITTPIFEKVLEYCRYHKDDPLEATEETNPQSSLETIDDWDQEFCKVDQATLYDLTLAANFLDIRQLLELLCKTIANMIKGKTTEQIRQKFNIQNDFTPEEEENNRRENAWVDDR